VKQVARAVAALPSGELGRDAPLLDVPVGAVALAQPAHLIDLFEPAAQAAILHPLLRSRLTASARHADLRGQAPMGRCAPPIGHAAVGNNCIQLYTTVKRRRGERDETRRWHRIRRARSWR